MRFIALDAQRDFCEVAIKDESGLRLGGRVKTSLAELELFAQSLAPDDQLALEAAGPAGAIARILVPHVARAVIANTRKLSAIAESKVKTDKVDASTLCELLAAGFLPAVWQPDEFTRALRRRLQRRSKLVRSRTRATASRSPSSRPSRRDRVPEVAQCRGECDSPRVASLCTADRVVGNCDDKAPDDRACARDDRCRFAVEHGDDATAGSGRTRAYLAAGAKMATPLQLPYLPRRGQKPRNRQLAGC